MRLFVCALAIALSVATAGVAAADTIDFEGEAAAGQQLAVGQNYSESGFNFYNPGLGSQAAIVGQSQNTSGSDYYTWDSPSSNNPVTLTNIGGANFDLTSLDVGSKSGSSAATFSITGYLSGGGTVSHTASSVSAFTGVTLNWTSLTKVEFAYGSGDFGAIDNLTLNAVPEPGTLALLGLGLLGVGIGARRRRATA